MFGLYGAGHVLYARTLKRVEASTFSILLNTNAIWIILMGYTVFHEHPHVVQLFGTVLILASVGIIAERSGTFRLEPGAMLGLLVGLIFGVAASAWVYVGKHSDVVTWTALSFAGTPMLLLLAQPASVRELTPFFDRMVLVRLVCLALFWGISNVAALAAYQRGPVSLIAPLQKTGVILTVLVAIIFLGERTRLWQKTVAASVCFLGVLLIVR